MEWSEVEQDWKRVCASMKQKWPGLTDADLEYIDRNKDAMVSKVHERTGLVRDTVERQLAALIASIAKPPAPSPPPRPADLPHGLATHK